MEWIEGLMTVIAFLSLMYGVICIDEHFQNHRNQGRFLNQREFTLDIEQSVQKELGK